jgi:hypothetical protein
MQIEKIDANTKFRYGFVVQPTHDYSLLKQFCKGIKFLTSGYEGAIGTLDEIERTLDEFDSELDVIIPSGKNFFNLLLGTLLILNEDIVSIALGWYSRDNGYTFYRIRFDE